MNRLIMVIIMLALPYFFYWVTPVDTLNNPAPTVLALINSSVCIAIELFMVFLISLPDFYAYFFGRK